MQAGSGGRRGSAFLRWLRGHRLDVAVLAPVLALTLIYFYPLLLSADVLYGGLDITRQFYLFKQAAVAALQAGELPVWLPELYCGMPLLGALIDTPFHPWDLAAALLRVPLPVIFNVGLLLHLLIGQVGAYVWVRQDTPRRLPALLAACWIWNPFVLNSIATGDHNNLRALLLAPAILAALERGLDRPRFRRAWLTYGLLQALQILCGGLQFAAYTMGVAGLTAAGTFLHRWRSGGQPKNLSRLRWWMTASALALVLPMAQLLPGLEFSALSVRGQMDVVWSQAWGIPPGLLLSYVAPFVDRDDHILLYWGIAPLWLAFVGMFAWHHPRRWWYVTILLAALVLCIGSHWSVSAWLNSLPLLRNFRGPFRIALFANLMLARLAAGGLTVTLDRIEQQQHRLRWRLALRRASGVAVLLMALALVWWPRSTTFTDWPEMRHTAVAWLATAAAVLPLYRMRALPAVWLLLLVGAGDVAAHLVGYWQPTSVARFAPDATVQRLTEQADGRRVWLRGTPSANYFSLFGIPSVAGHHAFPLARAARYAGALDLHDGRLLRLADTRYVLTYTRLEPDAPLGPPIRSPREVEVRTLKDDTLPRYSVQGTARWLPTGEAVWDVMRGRDWDPATHPVLLEGVRIAQSTVLGGGGTATVIRATPTEREFTVISDGPGYLVLADTWYPGWTATVNGHPAPVERANYLFQAVPVPTGGATVRLRFRSTSARVGLLTSALAAAGFVLAAGIAARRDARPAL